MRIRQSSILAMAALALCLIEGRPRACMMATHTFAVLLGWVDARPVYVEVELHRLDDARYSGRRVELLWEGSARTLIGGAPLAKPGLPTWRGTIGDRKIASQLAQWFKAGVSRLAREPKFVAAGMPEYRYCDFQRQCGDVRLQTGTDGSLSVAVGPSEKQRATLPLPAAYIAALAEDLDPDVHRPSAEGAPRSPATNDIARLKKAADRPVISRVMSYPAPGGGTLVIDLAYGDQYFGADMEDGIWPPCGCRALNACVPRAPTLHHGDHLEVVVAIPEHHTLRISSPAAVVEKPPTIEELRAAESGPRVELRADGIYSTNPECDSREWRRRHLLLFGDGHFEHLQANVSPLSAANLLGGGHFRYPLGNYEIRGRRIVGTLQVLNPRTSLRLDGIVGDGEIWARVRGGRDAEASGARFKFVTVESARRKPLTHNHR